MNARTKIRTSAAVQADIDSLKNQRLVAERRIDELNAGWDAVLLTGTDAQAEAHQAERARQERVVARVALKLPPLEDEPVAARDHEEQVRFAQQQATATAAVDAAISDDRLRAYHDAAHVIATFLTGWRKASEMAEAAQVPTPHERLRYEPGYKDPDFEESYTVYFDASGREMPSRYPAMQFDHEDEEGLRYTTDRHGKHHLIEPFRGERRTRKVKGRQHPSRSDSDLLTTVRLPAIRLDEPAIWPPKPTEPPSRASSETSTSRDAFGPLQAHVHRSA